MMVCFAKCVSLDGFEGAQNDRKMHQKNTNEENLTGPPSPTKPTKPSLIIE